MRNTGNLCPSARCQEGALLLGIVMPDGRIAHLARSPVVNAEFVKTASQGRAPEKRFRFASPCLEAGCAQWKGCRCGVIDAIAAELAPLDGEVPDCSIRPECRWFTQRGARACRLCPDIVSDVSERVT